MEVADKAMPPVVRIMDYGKYKYEAAQRAKESRKHQSANALKEMKYRPKIGKADFDTKTRSVEKFLGEGHKVKLTIMFRGREVYHPEIGRRILDQVAEAVAHVGRVETASKLDGRNMTMVIAPDKKAQAAWQAQQRRKSEPEGGAAPGEPAATQPPVAQRPAAATPPANTEAAVAAPTASEPTASEQTANSNN